MSQDAAWKEEVRENKGLFLSIDGIQLDRGNEMIYLVRDMFTGRIVTAENVTESTKERLKEVLTPVVALGLPVVGVISDAQSTQLQAVAELWPGTAHQICQFHAQSFAGRLIFVLDQRTKTEMHVRLQQKTHEYRQNIHKRMQAARATKKAREEELAQLAVLEEYAAMVEAALNVESLAPFDLRSSIRNSMVLGLITGLITGIGIGLPQILGSGPHLGLVLGLVCGLAIGLNFWLRHGAYAFILHALLRVCLWQANYAPLNYPRFLDFAVEHILLRRVGGGYIFIHRLLQEHFAASDEEVISNKGTQQIQV